MNDVEKLVDFLHSKLAWDEDLDFTYVRSFNLQELTELRELVQMAIVQRLCEYSPVMFDPIFKERLYTSITVKALSAKGEAL